MKKKWWLLVLIVVALVCLNGLTWHQEKSPKSTTSVPTIFLHGYSGTAYSTDKMIAALTRAGVAKQTMTVTVSPNGKMKVKGDLHAKHPLVQVVYQDSLDNQQFTHWLLQVYAMLHQRYHVQRVNAVGHSDGGTAVIEAAMQHPAVKMNKLVAIAAPFTSGFVPDGTTIAGKYAKNGKPLVASAKYRQMAREAKNFHAKAVLDLYGDLGDGSHSDGVVDVNAASSLKYLLRDWHGDYQEREVKGKGAQHSQLHENNKTVDTALRHFLFSDQ
ncbi:alpha/beta hydrolase [Lacticaseibacillus sp. GG6-2]